MTIEEKLLECLSARWKTGREISDDFTRRYGRSINYGSLYTRLRRLIEDGLVEKKDERDTDGLVRSFKLTGNTRQPTGVLGVPENV